MYGFSTQLTAPFDVVIGLVTDALKAESFGVLCDIDVQASQGRMMESGMMKGGPGMMGNRSCMMSQGMKGGHGKGMMVHGMMRKHQQVVNRLDLLDARMAKIKAMLERLIQR